jgi:ATP-dependent Clp protease protease subunit
MDNGSSNNTRSKKRKLDFDDDYVRQDKRPRYMVQQKDDMIYSIGTEIHFTAEINKENIEKIIKEINHIIEKNEKKYRDEDEKLTIAYIVDSPGGCVHSVLKFVDYIKMVKEKYPYIEFVSIITGLTASAGTIMCIAADKRLMTKYSHAMIHELSSGNSGKYTHLMSYSSFLSDLHNTLLDIYIEKSNKPREEMESILNTETWFNSQQYLEHGFIDEIK